MHRYVLLCISALSGWGCTSLNADFDGSGSGGQSGTSGRDSSMGTSGVPDGSTGANTARTDGNDSASTSGSPQRCGDGSVDPGEVCDDGLNDGHYGGCNPGCASRAARCGDGNVDDADEVCDDGVNDGAYGGCDPGCASRPAWCGDGAVAPEHGEECDDGDGDPSNGCMKNCAIPRSCLEIRQITGASESGPYQVMLHGRADFMFAVHCDMVTDGGGYTFLKLESDGGTFAPGAEAMCEAYGMQLWIPRTQGHRDAGWQVGTNDNIPPNGSPDYLRIMGIYPAFLGATCANEPLNSDNDDCDWDASDGERFWVDDHNEIDEPNGNGGANGSMQYEWQKNGDLGWYDDLAGEGGSSSRFMCDIGDKH